ncbi:SIS domain-containing protein [Granulicella mallensis]|uniref:Glutamine--fructose-6-phosphate aminotransferase [isomerizing] n=1 Tax=Granulicella mallensis (strain ATCC BAA-1857 / DSM 23137 / MP5ACTX8) TaxID=682795 RepID=G8P1T7_GRAMM|nr:SIS domain-containing protein [Granulicella mallensis]AEU35912.1 Glutamine--fructose-6-phosphate transaminase (isomerizing) [Granulicella mallensis MP5ACTX8]
MPETQSPAPYAHWMLREIHEQPETLKATLNSYVEAQGFRAETCAPLRTWLKKASGKIVIAASGSSRHAGLAAELFFEDLSGIHVDVEYASEYTYRNETALGDAVVMVVSQSGETADTLAALRKAKLAGHETLAITNVASSTMAKEATVSFPTEAGRERAIPATKSFTAQLLNLYLLSLLAAESRGVLDAAGLEVRLAELRELPASVKAQLPGWESSVRAIAERYKTAKNFLFLGRGVHYPIAREGALKLKESAYLHAEGYPSGELKHGPNALVSEGTPLVMIATVDRNDSESVQRYEKIVQLMRDMREQGANILAIANTGDEVVAELATNVVFVEPAREALLPMLEVITLQLLAYFMAINNGIDVDHPRNLTKAVLAE